MVVDELTDAIEYTDDLIVGGNEPWRIMAAQEGLSPEYLENRASECICLSKPPLLDMVKADLAKYRDELDQTVRRAIDDGHLSDGTVIGREVKALWQLPVMYKSVLANYFECKKPE